MTNDIGYAGSGVRWCLFCADISQYPCRLSFHRLSLENTHVCLCVPESLLDFRLDVVSTTASSYNYLAETKLEKEE